MINYIAINVVFLILSCSCRKSCGPKDPFHSPVLSDLQGRHKGLENTPYDKSVLTVADRSYVNRYQASIMSQMPRELVPNYHDFAIAIVIVSCTVYSITDHSLLLTICP